MSKFLDKPLTSLRRVALVPSPSSLAQWPAVTSGSFYFTLVSEATTCALRVVERPDGEMKQKDREEDSLLFLIFAMERKGKMGWVRNLSGHFYQLYLDPAALLPSNCQH